MLALEGHGSLATYCRRDIESIPQNSKHPKCESKLKGPTSLGLDPGKAIFLFSGPTWEGRKIKGVIIS